MLKQATVTLTLVEGPDLLELGSPEEKCSRVQ